jgi:hypothetical protein
MGLIANATKNKSATADDAQAGGGGLGDIIGGILGGGSSSGGGGIGDILGGLLGGKK